MTRTRKTHEPPIDRDAPEPAPTAHAAPTAATGAGTTITPAPAPEAATSDPIGPCDACRKVLAGTSTAALHAACGRVEFRRLLDLATHYKPCLPDGTTSEPFLPLRRFPHVRRFDVEKVTVVAILPVEAKPGVSAVWFTYEDDGLRTRWDLQAPVKKQPVDRAAAGRKAAETRRKAAGVAPVEPAAPKTGRAGVDWRAAGLKAAETRRRRLAERAAATAGATTS